MAQDLKKPDGIKESSERIKQLQSTSKEKDIRWPTAQSKDANNKPLLSWRVHLLPFVGETALYEKFHLNEPWDSEHNRKLIDSMPGIYRDPSVAESGKTTFLALVNKNSAITNEERGVRFADIPDGASNTILFVQVNAKCAVAWTKPEDVPFDPEKPMHCLGEKGNFTAVFCDGSVHQLPATIAKDTLRQLVDRRDGKPISFVGL